VETCETSGILNSAVNLVASIGATEALKVIVGQVASGAQAQVQEKAGIAALKRGATQGQVSGQKRVEFASPLRRTLLSFDVWTNEQAEIAAAKPRPDCRACGERDFIHLAGEGRPHITLCGRNSVQIHERQRPIDFAEMDRRLQPHGMVRHNDFVLKFWHEPYEMTLFPDGRAIIKGTTDTAVARSLYARYVGS